MTDKEKLDKLVAEIERRIAFFNEQSARKITTDDNSCALALQGVLGFYDSMQKESKECMYSKDNYTDEDRKVLCEGCEEECEFNKKEEPANDSFEAEVKKLWAEINTGHSYSIVDSYNIFYGLCMDIADWQKEQQNIIEPASEEQVKELAGNQHVNETCKENGDSLTQESVSEYLEKAAEQDVCEAVNTCSAIGIPNDHIPSWVQWKDKQLMAKAVDVTVHSDAGGYPCIPQIELYDYDKDIPLAKEGDKYKVILIKED